MLISDFLQNKKQFLLKRPWKAIKIAQFIQNVTDSFQGVSVRPPNTNLPFFILFLGIFHWRTRVVLYQLLAMVHQLNQPNVSRDFYFYLSRFLQNIAIHSIYEKSKPNYGLVMLHRKNEAFKHLIKAKRNNTHIVFGILESFHKKAQFLY